MATLIQWIITYAAIRFAIHIGLGVVTYGGVLVALNLAIGHAQTAYNNLPVATLQLASIGGLPDSLAIICGAMIARLSIQGVKKIAMVK